MLLWDPIPFRAPTIEVTFLILSLGIKYIEDPILLCQNTVFWGVFTIIWLSIYYSCYSNLYLYVQLLNYYMSYVHLMNYPKSYCLSDRLSISLIL